MRIARRNIMLAGVWLGLLVLSWSMEDSNSQLARREIGRLFPDFDRTDASRVVIEETLGAEGSNANQSIELVRRSSQSGDSGWVLPEHFDYPAGEVSVRQLFDALTSLTNLDLLSESAATHGDYGVGEDGLVLRVFGADGELLVGLVQGAEATPAAGSSLASYVRVLGSDEVYRVPRLGAIPTDPRRWLERHWISFEPGRVRSLRVTEENETAAWSRSEMERWSRDGAPVSARLLRSLLDRLNACFLDDVVSGPPQARAADLSLVIVLEDGVELEMNFAAPDPEGSREAWLGTEGHVVRFSAATCARIGRSLSELRDAR